MVRGAGSLSFKEAIESDPPMALTIVDSQVHVWADDSPERPWPASSAARAHATALSVDGLLTAMRAAGVARAIIVPPSWEGLRNDIGLAAIAAHPDKLGLMGRLAIEQPAARGLVATCKSQGMLGLRFSFLNDEQRGWLDDGTANWLWPAAERAGVPLMVLAPGCLAAVRTSRSGIRNCGSSSTT